MFPLRGFADPAVEKFPHRWMHLGAIGTLVSAMREAGCREVVMIGSLVRPRPWDVRFRLHNGNARAAIAAVVPRR